MTNARTTRRALLTSIMSLLLCCSMLMGTTFAWFTDTAVSTANRIVAGNLDVDLWMYDEVLSTYTSIADGEGDLFSQGTTANETSESLWEPGKTHIVYLAVANLGSLDLKYNIKLRIDGELKSALEYAILDDVEFGDLDPATDNWESIKALANGQTADFPSATIVDAAPNGKLLAKTQDYFALAVHMKETAGNEYQGKDVTIDIAVLATQLSNEEDSFGADYDQGAQLPDYVFPAKVAQSVAGKTVTDNSGSEPVEVLQTPVELTNEASTEGSIPVAATLPANVALEQGTTEVKLTVESIELPDNVTIADDIQKAVALDIHIDGVSETNTTVIPVTVEDQFPAGLTKVAVYHEGVQMVQVNSLNDLAKDTFYYDSTNGNVTLGVCGFSEFTFVYVDPTISDIVVSTPTNLQALLATGGDITLTEDIVLESTVTVPAGVTVELNMNGKTITGNNAKGSGAILANNGTLTIVGGTITNTAVNGDAVIRNSGSLVLDGVKLVGAPMDSTGYPEYTVCTTGALIVEDGTSVTADRGAIRMEESANVVINGGSFVVSNAADGRNMTLHTVYAYGSSKLTINDGHFEQNHASTGGASVICPAGGSIYIFGGEFFDAIDDGDWTSTGNFQNYMGYSAPVKVYGGTFDDKTYEKHLAVGCDVIENNGTYTVSMTKVSTADELVAALEAGKSVILQDNIKIDPANMSNAYGKTGINIKNGQTIDGNGYTLDIKGAGGTWDSGINTTGGLIRNLTVTGSFRGIFINHNSDHSEKVVLENVIIDGTTYTISCDQGLYQGIEATNCTFNGWTSFAKTAGEAKFVNCSFGEGSGYKYCRPYSNTEFVNCTFSEGYKVDTTQATVTFTDCNKPN